MTIQSRRVDAGPLRVGDRVTVHTTPADPVQLVCQSHVIVKDVRRDDTAPGGVVYVVGHAEPQTRNYGPFRRDRLAKGWGRP